VPNRGGPGDTDRTLAVCQRLVRDRDDMVVKALSWALRELARHDPSAVAGFVDKHSTDIAKRVRREVMNKLTTGVKSRLHQGRPPGSRLVDERAVWDLRRQSTLISRRSDSRTRSTETADGRRRGIIDGMAQPSNANGSAGA